MIDLKPVEVEHLEKFMEWRNDLMQFFRQQRKLTLQDQQEWYDYVEGGQNGSEQMYSIFDESELIGCCGLTYIDWISRNTEMSLYIGGSYIDDRARTVIDKLLYIAFAKYNLHKVYVEVFANDMMKYKLCEEAGFHLDGTIRDTYYHDDKYHNSHCFSMLKSEWEYMIKMEGAIL